MDGKGLLVVLVLMAASFVAGWRLQTLMQDVIAPADDNLPQEDDVERYLPHGSHVRIVP